MKLALDGAPGVNIIKSYEPGLVRIRNRQFDCSLIVLRDHLIEDWQPRDVAQLRTSHFAPLLAHQPEVLILGTGENQVYPEPASFVTLMDLGIGFEVMGNAAACRTYNILLSEDRRAALTLIMTGASH
jgi:uncharacterized protein